MPAVRRGERGAFRLKNAQWISMWAKAQAGGWRIELASETILGLGNVGLPAIKGQVAPPTTNGSRATQDRDALRLHGECAARGPRKSQTIWLRRVVWPRHWRSRFSSRMSITESS